MIPLHPAIAAETAEVAMAAAVVAAIDTGSIGNQRRFDLPQYRYLDSFQYSPGISLESLENAAFPFASRRSLKYR
jgi:hypothetical protein